MTDRRTTSACHTTILCPFTTSIGISNSPVYTWYRTARLSMLLDSMPTTNPFCPMVFPTNYCSQLVFWISIIIFFFLFCLKLVPTNAFLPPLIHSTSCPLYFHYHSTTFSPDDNSIWQGIPLKSIWGKCRRLPLLPSNGYRGTTTRDGCISHCGGESRCRRQHFPAILPLVY